MQVKEHKVIKRNKSFFPEAIAAPDDFVVDQGRDVDFLQIWKNDFLFLSPYCIDSQQQEVVFVRVTPEIDLLKTSPFFYQAQRLHAVMIYRLGFEQLYDLAGSLPDHSNNTGFIFSTGRCGSTLFGRLMEASPDIQCISEPDIYTQAAINYDFPFDETLSLLRACTRILVHIHCQRNPDRPFVLIKLRSQCTYIADQFHQSMPCAKRIYLYRNGLDVFNSFYVLIPGLIRKVMKVIPVDRWLFSLKPIKRKIEKMCPVLQHPSFSGIHLSVFNALALMWLSNMVCAASLEHKTPGFFNNKLRYEDLINNPVKEISAILQSMELAKAKVEKLEQELINNSQQGSRLESRGVNCLTNSDIEKFNQLIAKHPTIKTSVYRL